MHKPNKQKILAIASPGGHWIQLNKICKPLENQFEVVYITPGAKYNTNKDNKRIINITDASADSKLKLIPLVFQLVTIFIKERPTAIISTGAAPGAIAILLAKLLPIKTIWVDSIANVAQLSRSGRIVKNIADKVITQWEPLSDGRKVSFQGAIL